MLCYGNKLGNNCELRLSQQLKPGVLYGRSMSFVIWNDAKKHSFLTHTRIHIIMTS